MTVHSFYDLTPLAFVSGYDTEVLLPLAAASTLFLLALPEMAKRATELAGRVVPEKGMKERKPSSLRLEPLLELVELGNALYRVGLLRAFIFP